MMKRPKIMKKLMKNKQKPACSKKINTYMRYIKYE